jgi:hypothetical protein
MLFRQFLSPTLCRALLGIVVTVTVIRGMMATTCHVVVVVSHVLLHGKLGKTSLTLQLLESGIFAALK